MPTKLEMFNKEHCFTKEDVQQHFTDFVEFNWKGEENGYTETYSESLLELSDRFKSTLGDCRLPSLTDDWWFYDFRHLNDGIELNLYYCDEIEMDEEGELIGTTSSQKFMLLSVKCDYLTVDEFAVIHNVANTTVRQWIRRGKLRTAKKAGRDWLIPSITERPTRGFKNVSYHWKWLPVMIVEQFSFLEDYKIIYIFQNQNDRTKFDCNLGYPGEYNRSKLILSREEREKLELALIGNNTIEVDEY